MTRGMGTHALPFLYLGSVTALCGVLAVVGYVLDRLLPASMSLLYQRVMFATIFGLSRLIDSWMVPKPDPMAGGVAGDSAP